MRVSIEWIGNKVNLPNSKVNPNFNWFSLVVFHFSVYILQISVHFDRPQILIYSSIQDRYVNAMFLLHQYFSLKSNMKRNQNFTSIYFNFFDMGTLKSVCSSWSSLIHIMWWILTLVLEGEDDWRIYNTQEQYQMKERRNC